MRSWSQLRDGLGTASGRAPSAVTPARTRRWETAGRAGVVAPTTGAVDVLVMALILERGVAVGDGTQRGQVPGEGGVTFHGE